MSLWLSGAGGLGGGLKTLVSSRILFVLKSLLLDSVMQRRLLRQSGARWAIHSLIFLPFVIRFLWGAAALLASWVGASGTSFLVLVDKNHPLNAFFFDVTGLSIIVGVCAAIARGIATRRQRLPGLPGQDRTALALIGGVVVVGFVLEGMRMAMTGASGGAAFLGYALSSAFTAGPALARSYGYVWYLHAALTGAFVAYLPFSRMLHILVAPVVLAGRAVRHGVHGEQAAGD
jgi:nitrate reductase gamma subunit